MIQSIKPPPPTARRICKGSDLFGVEHRFDGILFTPAFEPTGLVEFRFLGPGVYESSDMIIVVGSTSISIELQLAHCSFFSLFFLLLFLEPRALYSICASM